MPDIINEYQKWKQQGEDLRVQAKHAMENRFRDLLTEAVQIADEYRADFSAVLKPPPAVTAFRYKASAKPKVKKPVGKGEACGCQRLRRLKRSLPPSSPIPKWPDSRSVWPRLRRNSRTLRRGALRRVLTKIRSTRSKTSCGWLCRGRQKAGVWEGQTLGQTANFRQKAPEIHVSPGFVQAASKRSRVTKDFCVPGPRVESAA